MNLPNGHVIFAENDDCEFPTGINLNKCFVHPWMEQFLNTIFDKPQDLSLLFTFLQ